MLTMTVTVDELAGVRVLQAEAEGTAGEEVDTGPNPIMPELKEVVWGFGSFVVLFVLMRYWLFPALKKGMDARYESIRADLDAADVTRATAEAEVAEYQAALAEVRAEAALRVDAARQQLETLRQERLAEVNASIGERRAVADAETEAAREAARSQVVEAAADVTRAGAEKVLGRPVDPVAARAAVEAALSAEVGR